MGEHLRKRLLQSKFESPVQEALLNLLVAAGHVRGRMEQLLEAHDITQGQYNVLRILRGAHPTGYPRCEIGRRMIERAPDLTRMIDRLVARGLVERGGSSEDGRHSVARITRRGLDLLQRMTPTLEEIHGGFAARLSRAEAEELSRLCEKLYSTE